MRRNGEFILLKNGTVVLYHSDWASIRQRLDDAYKVEPQADYIITQIVGVVDRPAPPVVRSIYESQS